MVSRRIEPIGIYRFLIGAAFRRWIATDCDRPFFESTCFYESRNSKKYSSFIFQTFPPYFWFLCVAFQSRGFSQNSVALRIQPGADVSVCFGAQLFCVFKIRQFVLYPLLLVPHLKSHRAGEFNFIFFHIQWGKNIVNYFLTS